MGGEQKPMYGLAEDLNRNGGGKGCGGSNGQLTGSNETALLLQWDGRTVRLQGTGQELTVVVAGPDMLLPECGILMGISIT